MEKLFHKKVLVCKDMHSLTIKNSNKRNLAPGRPLKYITTALHLRKKMFGETYNFDW